MIGIGNPTAYLIASGVAAVLIVALIIGVQLYKRRVMAAREKNSLRDHLRPSAPTWTWIVGMILTVIVVSGFIFSFWAAAARDLYTPQEVSAVVDTPTVVAENGQRFVQLGFDRSSYKLTYVCKPDECKGFAAGDKVVYTTYRDRATYERVYINLHKQ